MCVLYLAYRAIPGFPVVLAMNRDEFFSRPTAPAHFWPGAPEIPPDELLAGRDLEAGGTWLGITRHGRFAAISNFRDPKTVRRDARSRGEIVTSFLSGADEPLAFLAALKEHASDYNGFNLICGSLGADREELAYLSSRSGEIRALTPGIYGLSNAYLDTPWPKVTSGKQEFESLLGSKNWDERRGGELVSRLFRFLEDSTCAPDHALPDTGLGLSAERALSSRFIPLIRFGGKEYGTVSSTVVLMSSNRHVKFEQRLTREPSVAHCLEFNLI